MEELVYKIGDCVNVLYGSFLPKGRVANINGEIIEINNDEYIIKPILQRELPFDKIYCNKKDITLIEICELDFSFLDNL